MSNTGAMQNEHVLVSFLMPTLNAARTIERALKSIRDQTLAQDRIEILVIDGGSTDATREIAARYGAVILENPAVVPESAKFIGLQQAKGDFLVEMDSDEYLISSSQLALRLQMFQVHPAVKCILTDRLLTPPRSDIACAYLNGVGDPFSYFVYRLKGSVIKTFQKNRIPAEVDANMQVFQFGDGDLLPIADGGASMVDMRYVRSAFADCFDQVAFASTICGDVILKTHMAGCIAGDDIIHDSTARLSGYLRKLKFRVVNNVHDASRSGFSARADLNKTLKRRRYLYPLYCLLVIWPVYDAVALSISRKSATFLLHPLYVYYVMLQICIQYFRRLIKREQKNASYGG